MGDTYQLRIVEKQLTTINVSLKRNEIVNKEINSLSDEIKLYDKIGRIFVLSDKKSVSERLETNKVDLIKDLENQKGILKKFQDSINESTKHYNEVAKQSMKQS